MAKRRGDWVLALQRLTQARLRFPNNLNVQRELHEAKLRVSGDADTAVAAAHSTEPAQLADPDGQMRDIVAAFTSLGGEHRGCEFGEVQRFYGLEPLDLLRWTHIPPAGLIDALECRFIGVGTPEYTHVYPHLMGEQWQYEVADRRFGLGTHTYVKLDEAPQERVAEQTYRRMQYLRRELIDDLESGDKLFVYKTSARNLEDHELDRLHTAIRSYGGNATLLYVRYADEIHPDGTVEVARPGLLLGYLDRFGATSSGQLTPVPFASWEPICREAYRLWRAEASRGPDVA